MFCFVFFFSFCLGDIYLQTSLAFCFTVAVMSFSFNFLQIVLHFGEFLSVSTTVVMTTGANCEVPPPCVQI